MSDKPIIFSAPMVRALLEGRKTQTRRIIKPQPSKPWGSTALDGSRFWTYESLTGEAIEEWRLPYAPGDRLYVREAALFWIKNSDNSLSHVAAFRADGYELEPGEKWRPSIHMPRWASRLTLTVTDVRAQRLRDISEADAMAEGIERLKSGRGFYDPTMSHAAVRAGHYFSSAREAFQTLWNSLHGPEAWDANPWVAAYTFTVQHGNIDMLAERARQ